MKTGFLVMVLTTALLAAAMTGNVLAGDSRARSADPESAMNWTWMVQDATDTGKLPDAGDGAPEGSRSVSAGTDIPTVELGGVRYRPGIDVGA
jgi:hypothetical protein